MLFAALGALVLAPLTAWLSPISRIRTLPQPQEPVVTESVAEEMGG